MYDIAEIVGAYFRMWNEPDPARRAEHIALAWAEDGCYLDPLFEAEGHAALSELVEGVHARFPGHQFVRASRIDAHHDQVRFAWELEAADGTLAAAGIDVCQLAPDGRLQRVAGFFEELAAA
jgi:hypothetical protein